MILVLTFFYFFLQFTYNFLSGQTQNSLSSFVLNRKAVQTHLVLCAMWRQIGEKAELLKGDEIKSKDMLIRPEASQRSGSTLPPPPTHTAG